MDYWFKDSPPPALFDSSSSPPSSDVAEGGGDTLWPKADHLLWTDEAHNQYLGYLESKFVEDLYRFMYCSEDICGNSSSSLAASFVLIPSPNSSTYVHLGPENHMQRQSSSQSEVSNVLVSDKPSSLTRNRKGGSHWSSLKCQQMQSEILNVEPRGSDTQTAKKSTSRRPRKRKQKEMLLTDVGTCYSDKTEMDQVVPSACD